MNLVREWKNGGPSGKAEWLLELTGDERADLEEMAGAPLTPEILGALIDSLAGGEIEEALE